MPTKPRTIKVVANPYISIDAEGIPQGVVAMPGTRSMHIGAREDLALSMKTGKRRFYFPLTVARDRSNPESVPTESPIVECEYKPEIVRSVQDGELIAADEASARLCGIPIRENEKDAPLEELVGFIPWEQALEREKARAQAYYESILPEGVEGTVGEIPREEDADAKAWLLNAEAESTPEDVRVAAEKKKAPLRNALVGGRPATPGAEVTPGVTLVEKKQES